MDPYETLWLLAEAIKSGDRAGARVYEEHLKNWLSKGGFEPEAYKVADKLELESMAALNTALKRVGLDYVEACSKVRLDKNGYAPKPWGRYFGVGEPVYQVTSMYRDNGRFRHGEHYVRGVDRNAALYRFFRVGKVTRDTPEVPGVVTYVSKPVEPTTPSFTVKRQVFRDEPEIVINAYLTQVTTNSVGWRRHHYTFEVIHGGVVIFPKGQLVGSCLGDPETLEARELALASAAQAPDDGSGASDEAFDDYSLEQRQWASRHSENLSLEAAILRERMDRARRTS